MIALLQVILLFNFTPSMGAPFPAVASSVAAQKSYSQFLSLKGFDSLVFSDYWSLQTEISHQTDTLDFTHRLEKNLKLSIKIVERDEASPQELLQKRWVQDYSIFGFEILKNHTTHQSKEFFVDLYHREKKQMARQKVYFSKDKLAIVTCFSDQAYQKELSKNCP